MMNKQEHKRFKKKLKALRENPQAEIYSQERRVWETAVLELKQSLAAMEDGLIYKRAALHMAETMLENVKAKKIEDGEKAGII